MLEEFKPTWMVKSIYSVSPEQLKAHGIRAVFSDLDNTLIAWNNPEGTPELHQWMAELKEAGIPLIVISNNNKKRVAKAVANCYYVVCKLGADVYFHAVTHVEHLVHFFPGCVAFFMYNLEQRGNGEHVVFNNPAVLTHEMEHFCLCTSCAVNHSVYFVAVSVENDLYCGGVCASGG